MSFRGENLSAYKRAPTKLVMTTVHPIAMGNTVLAAPSLSNSSKHAHHGEVDDTTRRKPAQGGHARGASSLPIADLAAAIAAVFSAA